MQSLTEAHDDHMHQIADPSSDSTHLSSNSTHLSAHTSTLHRDPEPAQNDPWHIAPTPNTDYSHHQNVAEELQSEFIVPLEVERGCGFSRCISCLACACLKSRRTGYQRRTRLRSAGSSLTAEEEREYLMDCDELELTWEGSERDERREEGRTKES